MLFIPEIKEKRVQRLPFIHCFVKCRICRHAELLTLRIPLNAAWYLLHYQGGSVFVLREFYCYQDVLRAILIYISNPHKPRLILTIRIKLRLLPLISTNNTVIQPANFLPVNLLQREIFRWSGLINLQKRFLRTVHIAQLTAKVSVPVNMQVKLLVHDY